MRVLPVSIFALVVAHPTAAVAGHDEIDPPKNLRGGNDFQRSLLTYVKNIQDNDPVKLKHCEGDCDLDTHCEGTLVCFNRTNYEEVPGCPGGSQEGSTTDYCVKPEDVNPPLTWAYNVNLDNGDAPIGRCQGDCDIDAHCAGDLVCFERNGNEPVPGCTGGISEPSITDYCVRPEDIPPSPTPAPVVTTPVNMPVMAPASSSGSDPQIQLVPGTEPYALLPADAPRLGLCMGNCHMDSDCQDGLWCNQREPNEDVPGCTGGAQDSSNYDYCTYVPPTLPPTPMPAPFPAPTDTSFRLKMYWQDDYFWQEETFDRMWCMACKNGCAVGHSLHLTRCSGESAYLNFVDVAPNPGFPHRDQPEVLIRVEGTNLCLERDAENGPGWPEYQPITLQPCNAPKFRQRWFANGGSFDDPKFEINQYGRIYYCISQQHFPKHGELVRMEKITKARIDTTSYWVRY